MAQLSCGIVGLPNVGKSTIFNALTETAAADAQNYPFCTIEPNSGRVVVPDTRLEALRAVVNARAVVPTSVEIVDIAGLVRGASRGEGRGNAFLSAIKEVTAVVHVVRCFEDAGIVHVEDSIDPLRDVRTIDVELMLRDMDTVRVAQQRIERRVKRDKDAALVAAYDTYAAVLERLEAEVPVREQALGDAQRDALRELHLLTAKPMMLVCNVSEDDAERGSNALTERVGEYARRKGMPAMTICGRLEADLVAMSPAERAELRDAMGLRESGVSKLIRAGYELLGLGTYFTAGEKEVHAWDFRRGWRAPRAAAAIHTDFEKHFIRCEVAGFDDFVACGGERGLRARGLLRSEGADYVMRDGDVVHFLVSC